jgi:hypothetical protein
MEKLKTIEEFIEKYSDNAEQGSDTWLLERKLKIGGSEISTVEGFNPFMKLVDLVGQKIGLTKFNGNTATRWGNLFEHVSELMFKTLFLKDGYKIYNTGSIPNKVIKNHAYSPDGLCLMEFNGVEKIALLEFKSPSGSAPTSKVPKHYLPQVKAGLCTIDIAQIGVFANNMIRKCSLDQLDFSIEYDTAYHRDTEIKLKNINTTISNGIIFFSINENNLDLFYSEFDKIFLPDVPESDSDDESDVCIETTGHEFGGGFESDEESDDGNGPKFYDDGTNIMYKIYEVVRWFTGGSETPQKLIDFGDESKQMFDQFLQLYKPDNGPSFLSIKCSKPQINKTVLSSKISKNLIIPDELNYVRSPNHIEKVCKKYNSDKLIQNFINRCEKNKSVPIGYLPWKMIKSSNIIVEKDPEYLNNIKDKIDNTIDTVKKIIGELTDSDLLETDKDTKKAELLEKYFPDNPVTKNYFDSIKTNYMEFL